MLLKYLYLKEYTRMKEKYMNELESIQNLLNKVRKINDIFFIYNPHRKNYLQFSFIKALTPQDHA